MQEPGRSYSAGNQYRYGFNGKENDNDVKGNGNQQDYGMRIYDPRLGKFLSVDPLTKTYPELTPFQFASNTPIWGVDWDGEEVRIYTETTGLTGHAFLTVGTGKDLIVYTYGRYAGVLPTSGMTSGALSPTGPGVLIKLTGARAFAFVQDELLNNKAKSFEIKDANQNAVIASMDKIYNSSTKIPEVGKYKNDPDAHIVDKYDILSNSCVSKTICGAKSSGTKETFVQQRSVPQEGNPIVESTPISPAGLQDYLQDQSLNENSTIREVTYKAKMEFNAFNIKFLPIPKTDHPEDNQAKKNTPINRKVVVNQ